MDREPIDYALVMRYVDESASDEERRRARDYLLQSPEARAFLVEVAGQMVHLIDHRNSNLPLSDMLSGPNSCTLQIGENPGPVAIKTGGPEKIGSQGFRRIYAATVLAIAGLLLATFMIFRESGVVESPPRSIQVTDYRSELSVSHGSEKLKSPFRELPRVYVGDSVETHSWFSWGELKLESGSRLTLMVNSSVHIRSLTKDRLELDLISGGVRVSAMKDDPMEFVVQSDRLKVVTRGSDTLVWDFNFMRALAGCYSGSADVTGTGDEMQKVLVGAGEMASIGYNEAEFEVGPQPLVVDRWSSEGMNSVELGTGLWKKPTGPEQVKLLAAPKTYILNDYKPHQIQEVMVGVWRRPNVVGLKQGSRLVVTGKYEKASPITFSLRTHLTFGKFLDLFNKTVDPAQLAAAGQRWRVEIPLEEMQPVFNPGQDPTGSLLFNISIYSYEAIGLEVNSIELRPPD